MQEFLTPQEVARKLGVTVNALKAWRRASPSRGPRFVRLSGVRGRVRYPADAVAEYLDTLIRRRSTSERETLVSLVSA